MVTDGFLQRDWTPLDYTFFLMYKQQSKSQTNFVHTFLSMRFLFLKRENHIFADSADDAPVQIICILLKVSNNERQRETEKEIKHF